ncbi:type II toxin-antitoxin system Phd/YefM family antitoxin [Pseudonocardia sp. GCM10023141]|uniref:type II toxin-antitoxin system Phd/YefM family antitoxin n=1 Tax=Pseudonocardia sp. GCM10023141 TaxID=3252653 RepID=UPI0036190E4D
MKSPLEVAMDIGIRELRDGLSRYLDAVKDGRTVTVTDHGKPIARIVPVGEPTRLERLRAEGRIQPASRRKRPAPEPVAIAGTVSDLIDDQRR